MKNPLLIDRTSKKIYKRVYSSIRHLLQVSSSIYKKEWRLSCMRVFTRTGNMRGKGNIIWLLQGATVDTSTNFPKVYFF